jgi:hypothetical protein
LKLNSSTQHSKLLVSPFEVLPTDTKVATNTFV